MFDILAQIDLFELPFGKTSFKTLLDTGIEFPLIKRRLAFYIDYFKHMSVGGSLSLTFVGSHNLHAQVNLGPIITTVSFTKPWKYEPWATDQTKKTELGEGQLLPDPQ